MNYSVYPTLLDAYAFHKKFPTEEKTAEFFDKLNRKPTQITPQIQKGIDFNNLVDSYINGKGVVPPTNKLEVIASDIARIISLDGPVEIQKYIEGTILVDGATVKLYGFVDYLTPGRIWELKTTAKYRPFFLSDRWQRFFYMYCLPRVPKFTFITTDFNKHYLCEFNSSDQDKLVEGLRDFIGFIEKNKDKINNPTLFS
jgi:hypothetical protein